MTKAKGVKQRHQAVAKPRVEATGLEAVGRGGEDAAVEQPQSANGHSLEAGPGLPTAGVTLDLPAGARPASVGGAPGGAGGGLTPAGAGSPAATTTPSVQPEGEDPLAALSPAARAQRLRLGLSEDLYDELGESPGDDPHALLRTRSEYRQQVGERFGTQDSSDPLGGSREIQHRIEEVARERGVSEPQLELFRRMHSPDAFEDAFASDPDGFLKLSSTAKRKIDPSADGESGEAYNAVARALSGEGIIGKRTLQRHRRYHCRTSPEILTHMARNKCAQWSHHGEIVAEAIGDFGNLPRGERRQEIARRRGLSTREVDLEIGSMEDQMGVSIEELSQAAAARRAHLYLWPEERTGGF